MQPRFVGRFGLADAVTVGNAAVGFLAAVAATFDPGLAARLLLLAAISDGLDGIVARARGSTPVGEYLDSLADVASFCVATGMFVYGVALVEWGVGLDLSVRSVGVLVISTAFVVVGVIRLGLFTAYEVGEHHTDGVQTTLAATILAAAFLAGGRSPALLLGATLVFCYLMVAPITYPDLYDRDAFAMGVVQALALLFPSVWSHVFPRILLVVAIAYLLLAPRFYWRPAPPDRDPRYRNPTVPGNERKGS